MVTLTMGIGIYPQGTIKPSEVWNLGKDQYNWPIQVAMKFTVKRLWWKMKKVVIPHWKLTTNTLYKNLKSLYKL